MTFSRSLNFCSLFQVAPYVPLKFPNFPLINFYTQSVENQKLEKGEGLAKYRQVSFLVEVLQKHKTNFSRVALYALEHNKTLTYEELGKGISNVRQPSLSSMVFNFKFFLNLARIGKGFQSYCYTYTFTLTIQLCQLDLTISPLFQNHNLFFQYSFTMEFLLPNISKDNMQQQKISHKILVICK